MRDAQRTEGSAACVEETVKNVNLSIASTSTRRAKNAAIVYENGLFIMDIEHL